MSLRTAPCPTCTGTIVFGERRCRQCGMPFDYGASPPSEPTAQEVFDTLSALSGASAPVAAPAAPLRTGAPAPARPAPARRAASTDGSAMMEGLDTGRFEVGEVPIDDVPGLIDSTLFAVMTPAHVDVALIQGLETTQLDDAGAALAMAPVPGLQTRDVEVGDVAVQVVPGLFGSDLFKTDVDIAAGAAGAGDMLELSPNAGRVVKSRDTSAPRSICPACSTLHFLSRCPSCGTAAPAHDDK